MAQPKKLSEMSPEALERLKIRWQYEVYELERKQEIETARIQRMELRTSLLLAAKKALAHLHSAAQQILAALETAQAAPELIAEQQAVVDKYALQQAQLPSWSKKVPSPTELQLNKIRVEELAEKRSRRLNRIAQIDEVLGGLAS